MEATQEESVSFVDYIVTHFDLMGQKEKLDQLRKTPTNEKEKREFDKISEQTYLPVKCIRNAWRESVKFFKSLPPAYIDITIEEPECSVLKKKVESNLQLHFYSDFFAVTCRYSNDDNKPLIQHICALLTTLSFMIIRTFGNGTPLRGGIEIGKAFEWYEAGDVGIYGPVMADVHKLESEIAWYPRIVMGKELNKSISDWKEKLNKGDRYYIDYKETIDFCKRMIIVDNDGIPTLDYLSSDIFCIAKHFPEMTKGVETGWEFINCEYERIKNEKKSSLAMKYFHLKEYYKKRLSIWSLV